MSDPAAEGQWIRLNFGKIWPVHLSAFSQLLVALRKHFDGDLDLMLVLAVIGERTRPQHWFPSLDTMHRLTADECSGKQHPINGLSIAAYTGIPRETVRRKLALLESKGWIAKTAEGNWIVTQRAAEDLAPATGDTISYLSVILATVRVIDADDAHEDGTTSP